MSAGQLLLVRRLTNGKHQRDPLGQQAAGHEGQCPDGPSVQPLGVVDNTEQRLIVSGVGKQAQDGETTRNGSGGGPAWSPNAGAGASR
jgi:hypothetical protein